LLFSFSIWSFSMSETLSVLPLSFWAAMGVLTFGTLWSASRVRDGIGFPVMAVLFTIGVWYMGDALYNDYVGEYRVAFTEDTLVSAWWQVTGFLLTFLILTPAIHQIFNAQIIPKGSHVMRIFRTGVDRPDFQRPLMKLFWACILLWLVLVAVAVARLGNEIRYYFFPFLAYKADPWARERVGQGFDSVLSLAAYAQMFVVAIFGVVAALAKEWQGRWLALVLCLLTWPYYIFDRTRNPMLAIAIPPILGWVFLRLRGGFWQKTMALSVCFLAVNSWLAFVSAERAHISIAAAVKEHNYSFAEDDPLHHKGLNMFEELCWVNAFFKNGTLGPNWGRRYVAELVNPIPRGLWHGKPVVGIDYSVARGQSLEKGQAGVGATIATGIVGQGIDNFGTLLGPPFAALLMAIWASILARLDLRGEKIGYIPLYALGLILTFNLGRDITFITLYTFVIGAGVIWGLNHWHRDESRNAPARRGSEKPVLPLQPARPPRRGKRHRSAV
jgi:hypothetical protein